MSRTLSMLLLFAALGAPACFAKAPAPGETRNLAVRPEAPAAAPAPAATAASEPAPAPEPQRPPPPTIADLVLLLQSYTPDPERIAELRAAMEAPVPEAGTPAALAVAWHTKAVAASELHDFARRAEFLARALEAARGARELPPNNLGGYLRIRSELAGNLLPLRGATESLDSFVDFAAELDKGPLNGFVVHANCQISGLYQHLGDLDRAAAALAKAEAAFRQLSNRRGVALNLAGWSRQIEVARGNLLRRQGRIEDEERAFRAALRQGETGVEQTEQRQQKGKWAIASRAEDNVDFARTMLAQTLLAQERLDEAELELREVLKRGLAREGRSSTVTGRALASLGNVYLARGRAAEAVVIGEWAERALGEAGLSEQTPLRVNARIGLSNALTVAGRYREAAELVDRIRVALKNDVRLEEGFAQGTLGSIRSYLGVGRLDDALRDGEHLLARNAARFGPDHYYTAEARAYRAMVLHRVGRVDEARREFERAVGVLVDPTRSVGRQKAGIHRVNRLRSILNEYLVVLVGRKGTGYEKDVAEAFRVADVARWQSVQKAVAGSALRAAAGSPELGARIKKVQDTDDELEAVYKNLISQRSAPPERQLPAVIAAMEARIAALKKEQAELTAEIRRQFPQYDALVNPRPADLATAQRALRPGEVLLSIYVTPGGAYVWASGTSGELRFHFSPRPPAWIAERVNRLRASVDLSAAAGAEQMRFDTEAGLELYDELLAPVREAWRGADTLLVVSNGALAQLPFSMLPTAKPAVAADGSLPLARFKAMPWLVREIAVAYLPSVSALVTLRALPAADARREPFAGFGDPEFGSFAAPAAAGTARGARSLPARVRNLKIAHAPSWDETATNPDAVPATAAQPQAQPLLTPLPDTRDEILAIAAALGADPQRTAYFGNRANRQAVMETDLRNRRIVAFATHGLVAGDLPGLDQPALALAPPPGADIDAGLLKLEHILRLSLNSDLVVLSACNTAAADGNGAEAVSGLGRGFFYAGARSVLATHWPVETVSARELVTHLFQRYARTPGVTRAAALRQAMLALIDGGVSRDARGRAEYSYAHPAFWAPYALYGDPGR